MKSTACNAGAGANPMTREDYRQAIRGRMLTDVRRVMLLNVGAPAHVVAALSGKPLREWPPQAREKIRAEGCKLSRQSDTVMFMSEIYSYETSEQVEDVGQPYYVMVLEGQNSVVRVDATTITREQMAAIVGPENVDLFPPVTL